MEKATAFIYGLALNIVKYLGIVLIFLLFVSSFLVTCYAEDMESQLVLTRRDNILTNVLGIIVALGIFWLVGKTVSHKPKRYNRLLLCFVLIWYLITGLILVLFGKTVPSADCMSVYSAAQELAAGNTGVIHPTDSYLSYYPQQMGLVAYYELLIRLWNLLPLSFPAYHFIKCVNIVWAMLLILFQYRSIQLLFADDRINTVYLLLTMCNFPFIMYTSFVYGEIPSFALFSIVLWAILKLLGSIDRKSFCLSALVSIIALAGAVALRKNTLILTIAVVLVISLEAVRQRKPQLFCLALCYVAAACITLPLITHYYEHRAGNTLRSGVPPMSYFAMGMQESSRADGWYNGFNFNTYQDTGMDTRLTNERSAEAIYERLAYFKAHPSYAFHFYKNKFCSQWCDGTYASRQATLATFGGRSEFFQQLYEGTYSKYYIGFCNLLQNLLYLGCLVFCFLGIHKKEGSLSVKSLPTYLCLIGIIGGFLFHMVWEANARYIFPYGLLLLPYSACGISQLLKRVS